MKLHQYLKEVLIFSERLVLPGFGCLKIERKPATAIGGKFTPPASVLVFDQTESMDDEVLSSKLSAAEEISMEEARQRIMEYIDSIKFTIDRGDTFYIEEIGSLRRNDDGDFVVEMDSDLVIDFDSYGLESFELDEFIDEEKKDEEIKVEKPENDQSEDDELPAREEKEAEPVADKVVIENPQPVPEPVRQNKNTVWVVLGLVVIVASSLIILFLRTDLFNRNLDYSSFINDDNDSESVVDPAGDDFSFNDMVSDFKEDIDSATEMENALAIDRSDKKPVKTETNKTSGYIEYHIIAGSFKDMENARELQKQLTLEGYSGIIIEPGNGIYRVSAMSFKDKPSALVKLIEFRDKANLPEAWLMEMK